MPSISLDLMQRRLVFRFAILDIIPLVIAAFIASSFQRFAPVAFVVVATLTSINALLSLRDGATLSRGGDVIEKHKNRFLFWLGMSVHFVLVGSCLFLAAHATFKA